MEVGEKDGRRGDFLKRIEEKIRNRACINGKGPRDGRSQEELKGWGTRNRIQVLMYELCTMNVIIVCSKRGLIKKE